jgi:hypothetical protein
MQKQQLAKIINKHRSLARSAYASEDEEKAEYFERFADYVEDSFDLFEENELYETEEDLLDSFQNSESANDTQLDSAFPEGDDDD